MSSDPNHHGNQLDNYQGAARAKQYYETKPHVRELVDHIIAQIRPDMCCIPTQTTICHSVRSSKEGRVRERVSIRAVVFHASGREVPKNGFLHPSCRNRGCVNPDHQVFAHVGGFAVDIVEPRFQTSQDVEA